MVTELGGAPDAAGRGMDELKVLLILDDEIEIVRALYRHFRRKYAVYTASNAEEAYRILAEQPVQVIIADQRMPGTSGVEFFKRVMVEFPDVSRLLLSGYSDIEAVISAINEARILRYIAKPWNPDDLDDVVDQAFDHYHRAAENRRLVAQLKEANALLEERVQARTEELAAINQALRDDIARRQQAETEREQLIVELDAFAHTVAHDLKTPLGVVAGYTSLLMEDFEHTPPDQVLKNLEIIKHGSLQISRIISGLLLLASLRRLDEIPLRPLNMGRLVDEAQIGLMLLVEQYQAEIVVPKFWPVAVGYAPWIEEVWINYISNAIKYGGTPPRVELGAAVQSDGMVRFWVRDNGLGIPPEKRSLLFGKFTRLDEARAQGHGLGLSIVQRIVERLGGQVGVESPREGGSIFSFTLPAAVPSLTQP